MKTTKHNLNAIAMGVALAMGSFSAHAVPENPSLPGVHAISAAERISDYPTFEAAERTGLALVESALSLIAARTHIDPEFCSAKTYQLSVDSSLQEVIGQAQITADGFGGSATLTAVTGEYVDLLGRSSGAQVIVLADPAASLAGAAIKGYKGTHQWSRLNNIFLDSAVWTFVHPQSGRLIPYDEHSIKATTNVLKIWSTVLNLGNMTGVQKSSPKKLFLSQNGPSCLGIVNRTVKMVS